MDVVADLGPPPRRLPVRAETVRALVAEQFPEWSHLPVTPVRNGGWDNWTFHLGGDLLARLPSAAEYALAVPKERRWLPELARRLPVPIPLPRGAGAPGAGYPFDWSVYAWLEGEPADWDLVTDRTGLAVDVAEFLTALRAIDATHGPQPGVHNWFRGATLRTYDGIVRSAMAQLRGVVDVRPAEKIWQEALAAPWDGRDVWFHGDLAPGNLLLSQGRLSAVIDFGTCGVGDPSCDLAVAWTLLTGESRAVLRDLLGIDDGTWARGRGWALWKTLDQLAGAYEDDDGAAAARASRVLQEIYAEGDRSGT